MKFKKIVVDVSVLEKAIELDPGSSIVDVDMLQVDGKLSIVVAQVAELAEQSQSIAFDAHDVKGETLTKVAQRVDDGVCEVRYKFADSRKPSAASVSIISTTIPGGRMGPVENIHAKHWSRLGSIVFSLTGNELIASTLFKDDAELLLNGKIEADYTYTP